MGNLIYTGQGTLVTGSMTANTQKINAKSVAKYVLLPGIIPRAKELGSEGFGILAFLFASVFQAVRILPASHPFLQTANIGKFSIIQVLVAAANNIHVSRRNLDQVVVFGAILMAIVLLFLQIILLLCGIMSGAAFAQSATATVTWTTIFETQYPEVDIAFLMLDYVFGLPTMGGGAATTSFFGSNALQATGGPTPFHQGMHALFNFYNLALLLVGALIFIYYLVVVVVETAQTGVPFGRRFSKLYAPFRLVIAVGLLVPIGYGFNSAQYITLYAAKLGSSFATNGWLLYNKVINEEMKTAFNNPNDGNPTGASNKSLVARPRFPPSDELLYFSSVYHACREIYAIWSPANYINPQKGTCINAYVVINGTPKPLVKNDSPACQGAAGGGGAGSEYTYADAKKDFGRGDLEIVLGEYNPEKHTQYAGGVRPYCGKMTVSLGNDNPSIWAYTDSGDTGSGSGSGDQDGQAGIRAVESIYFDMVKELLRLPGDEVAAGAGGGVVGVVEDVIPGDNPFNSFGERAAHATVPTCKKGSNPNCTHDVCHKSDVLNDAATCGKPLWTPTATAFQDAVNQSRTQRDLKLNNAYKEFRNGLNLKIMTDLEKRGWGGAGIWYNYIADVNGSFTNAIYAAPSVRDWPQVMEFVRTQRQAQDKAVDSCNVFNPNLGDNKQVEFTKAINADIAKAMSAAYQYFNCEKPNQDTGTPAVAAPTATAGGPGGGCGNPSTAYAYGTVTKGVTSNIFIDFISVVFGLNGLFDIRSCSEIDPTTGQSIVHPLAQLSTIGKSLVENSIRSMAMALGAAFGGGLLGMLGNSVGAALGATSSMFVGIASIGLTAGFVLYYILPFLPFIYFFFAVGSWVKSIFEAMVGAPLWALAHLRIDGDGLPGQFAVSGYFLIFEIFLRPIVTVFGLIGGMAIFGAMAAVLNTIFDLVVMNVTAAPPEGSTATVNIGAVESFRRGVVDQFFFTIMYAVLLYMMATASFKMIDTVPKYVMRWINSKVPTFNDNKSDPTENLTSYVAVSGAGLSRQVFSGLTDLGRGAGQTLGAILTETQGKPKGGA
jgi:hypothetical protein